MAGQRVFTLKDEELYGLIESELVLKEAAFNQRIDRHKELTGAGSVSPKVFIPLLNEDLTTLNESRQYLAKELEEIREQFEPEPEGTDKKVLLGLLLDTGNITRKRHDDALKRVLAAITGSTPRVNWTKHHKNNALVDLAEWLQLQLVRISSLIEAELDTGVRGDFEAAYAVLYKAATGVPALAKIIKQVPALPAPAPAQVLGKAWNPVNKPAKTTKKKLPKTAGKKRPRDDDDDGGNANTNNNNGPRPNAPAPPGAVQDVAFARADWWGPNNSRLHCPESFYEIMRQYRAYINNPTSEPGTRQHRIDMTTFLRRALRRAGLRDRLDNVLLKNEWNFRDPRLSRPLLMNFLDPRVEEEKSRIGTYFFLRRELPTYFLRRGTNHFKEMLGGGLTAAEEDPHQDWSVDMEFRGMAALARLNKEHSPSLRGGGGSRGLFSLTDSEDENDNSAAKQRENIRKRMAPKFRNPRELWDDVVADVRFPRHIFNERREAVRPPMIEPDRAGQIIDRFRGELFNIEEIGRSDAYAKIQEEQNNIVLHNMAERYLEEGNHDRVWMSEFLYRNKRILIDEPKLNEEGGKDEPKRRYQNLPESEFVAPIGLIFRARALQVLRLAITWKLYLAGERSLLELLAEERRLLQVWDEHEELYMEWENYRWFNLKSQYEKADLSNRYQFRELLRVLWQRDRDELDEAISKLRNNAQYYENQPTSSQSVTTPRRGYTPRPSSSHRTPVQSRINKPQATPTAQPQLPTPATTGGRARGRFVDLLGLSESEAEAEAEVRPLGTTPARAPAPAPAPTPQAASGPAPGPGGYSVGDGVRFLQTMRDTYSQSAEAAIRANNQLDPLDPGSHAAISRNNIDIMAKQQVIWALDSEIHNARRSVDPLAPGSVGRGAEHTWELPSQEVYTQNIREIITEKPLPLGDTSLGLGPMPGEHPKADDPRIFFGAHPTFGTHPDPDEEMGIHPVGDDLFNRARPSGAGPAQQTQSGQPSQAQAGPSRQANTGVSALGKRAQASYSYLAQAADTPTTASSYPDSSLPRPEGLSEMMTLVRRYGLDGTLDNSVQLQQAKDLITEARDRYKATGAKLEAAKQTEMDGIAALGKHPSDKILQKLMADAQRLRAQIEEEYAEVTAVFRVLGEALEAQRAWEEWEPEKYDTLLDRYRVLVLNFSNWANEYDWVEMKLTPRNAVDQWILEVIMLMHETYKAIGVNSGPAYWVEMYRSFWKTPGNSLWKMRAVWLQALMEDINHQITASGAYIFVETPPKLEVEWDDFPQPVAKLMEDAAFDLAQPLVAETPMQTPAAPAAPADPFQAWKDPIPPIKIAPAEVLSPEGYRQQVKMAELLQEVRKKNKTAGRTARQRHGLPAELPPAPPGANQTVTVPTVTPAQQARLSEMMRQAEQQITPSTTTQKTQKTPTRPTAATQGPTPVSAPRPPKTPGSRPKVTFPPLPPPSKPLVFKPSKNVPPHLKKRPITPAATPAAPKQQAPPPSKRPKTSHPAPQQKNTTRPTPTPAPAAPAQQQQQQPPAKKQALTPASGAGAPNKPVPVPAKKQPQASPAKTKTAEGEKNDGWYDLKELIRVTWQATIAHEALQQMPGDYSDVPPREGPDKVGFPMPVRKVTPLYYYDL
ncbi:hypothetical protein GGR51DRAFT_565647 [Nemania sp. FL0031]|nr:hypothetical protein GGR51DRAFT_565647 [Nemania sp. FL0031]